MKNKKIKKRKKKEKKENPYPLKGENRTFYNVVLAYILLIFDPTGDKRFLNKKELKLIFLFSPIAFLVFYEFQNYLKRIFSFFKDDLKAMTFLIKIF